MKTKQIILLTVVALLVGLFAGCQSSVAKDVDLKQAYAKIKEGKELPALTEITDDLLTDVYGLQKEDLKQYAIYYPLMNVSATMFVFVEAQEGKKESVVSTLETYMEGYEESWSMYLPEQYDLVMNREVIETGNYYCIIISDEAKEYAEALRKELGL